LPESELEAREAMDDGQQDMTHALPARTAVEIVKI
jgi:hypothetical protein